MGTHLVKIDCKCSIVGAGAPRAQFLARFMVRAAEMRASGAMQDNGRAKRAHRPALFAGGEHEAFVVVKR
jgi:hypothetical protein